MRGTHPLTFFDSYLTVDYERSKFYFSQCQFDPGASENIVPILPINSASTDSPSSGHSLSIGAIVGIIACVVIGILIIAGLIYFRKNRRSKEEPPMEPPYQDGSYEKPELDASGFTSPTHEIGGRVVEYFQPEKPELGDTSPRSPVPPDPIYEMTGDSAHVAELSAPVERPREVE
jgi:hypothetical protein